MNKDTTSQSDFTSSMVGSTITRVTRGNSLSKLKALQDRKVLSKEEEE